MALTTAQPHRRCRATTMTTDRTSRRRPKQAPVARILATGAALTATGTLAAVMAAEATPAAAPLTAQPTPAAAVAGPSAPPRTVVVIQAQAPTISGAASARPRAQTAQTSPRAGTGTAAPSAGQAVPAPSPQRQPAPVAISTGS